MGEGKLGDAGGVELNGFEEIGDDGHIGGGLCETSACQQEDMMDLNSKEFRDVKQQHLATTKKYGLVTKTFCSY